MPGIYVSVLINPGILSGLCGQFNQQLDDGEYAQAGIDINMAVFFILVVCAECNGAVWNQGAVLLAGKQYRGGSPVPGPLEHGEVTSGIPMGRDDEEHGVAAEFIGKPVEKPLPLNEDTGVIQGGEDCLKIFGRQ